jgi:hypothetical protein
MYARNAITNAAINLEFLFLWTVLKGAPYFFFVFLTQPRNSSREDSNLACWPIRNLEFLHKPCDANKPVILCVKTVWWVFCTFNESPDQDQRSCGTRDQPCALDFDSQSKVRQFVCGQRPSHFLTIRVNFHNHDLSVLIGVLYSNEFMLVSFAFFKKRYGSSGANKMVGEL